MAQIRIVKPVTIITGSPEGNFIPRPENELDIVEVKIYEAIVRMTISEFDYFVKEVNDARATVEANRRADRDIRRGGEYRGQFSNQRFGGHWEDEDT